MVEADGFVSLRRTSPFPSDHHRLRIASLAHRPVALVAHWGRTGLATSARPRSSATGACTTTNSTNGVR